MRFFLLDFVSDGRSIGGSIFLDFVDGDSSHAGVAVATEQLDVTHTR